MSDILREVQKIPPVTRFLCLSTLAVSLPVMMMLLSPYPILHDWRLVLRDWQFWRPFTSLFLGRPGIGFLFDFIMLYRYSDELETLQFGGRSPDYAWQLFLASCAIIVINTPLQSRVHSQPLLLALLTLNARLAPPGTQTSIFGLVSIPIEYLPYAMVGIGLIAEGPGAAALATTGVIVGWAWSLVGWGDPPRGLAGRIGTAPSWVKSFVSEGPSRGSASGGVHVIPPRDRDSGSTGHRWGGGQRLGTR